jgi:hypothetical protein
MPHGRVQAIDHRGVEDGALPSAPELRGGHSMAYLGADLR